MPSIPPAIYAAPPTQPPSTTTTGSTSAHHPQLHFLNHHREHQPQQQQAPALGHHHHHSFHRIDHDHPHHDVSQHVKPFSPAAPVAPVMPGAHHHVASLSQSGSNARASASLGAAASPAHPSAGHKAQHHPPSGSFVFNASSHHHHGGGNTGNPRHLHHSMSYTATLAGGAHSSSSASMNASSSGDLPRLQSPYHHNPYSWADGVVPAAAAARAQGEGRRTELSPGDLSRTARPGTPPPATAAGVMPLPPALPNFACASAAVSAPDDVATLAAPAVAVGAPFNVVGAPGGSAGPNSSRGATTAAASAAEANALTRSAAPPPPRYSSVSVGGQSSARGEYEQQQQQQRGDLHHHPVNNRRPPQQQQHHHYLGRPELGVESLASASSVVSGLLGDLDGAVCLSPLVTLTAATVGVEAITRGLPPAPPALPPVPPPALTHAASRLSGPSAASASTAPMVENQQQQPAVAPAAGGTVAKGIDVTAAGAVAVAAACANTMMQQQEGEEDVYVLDNVKPQHRLAMPYVPLPAVLAATLRSQRRARGEPCGDGVTSWGADELAKELNEDAPGGARTRMASVFVAQLPFDMPLEALQSLADDVVPGGPVRIVLAAPHLRNRRSYDGCAFLRMPEADAHRFVAALHKRVLFDVDGAWYAETAEHTEAIAAYCDWIQNKTKTLRRRLLPRPTPYSPMTAEFAIKSGSRISRSRTVRMSSSEDAEDVAEMP